MITRRMKVHKYLPDKLYGFCVGDEGDQVFFYLSVFTDKREGGRFIPPILGEHVEVTYQEKMTTNGEAPRAQQVVRVTAPKQKMGIVDGFDVGHGYGFIEGDDAQKYYMHRSEVMDGRLPLKGQRVAFYVGDQQPCPDKRPRACHITIL